MITTTLTLTITATKIPGGVYLNTNVTPFNGRTETMIKLLGNCAGNVAKMVDMITSTCNEDEAEGLRRDFQAAKDAAFASNDGDMQITRRDDPSKGERGL